MEWCHTIVTLGSTLDDLLIAHHSHTFDAHSMQRKASSAETRNSSSSDRTERERRGNSSPSDRQQQRKPKSLQSSHSHVSPSASTNFFIVHESVIAPSGGPANSSSTRGEQHSPAPRTTKSESRAIGKTLSPASHEEAPRSRAKGSRSSSSSGTALLDVDEEDDGELDDGDGMHIAIEQLPQTRKASKGSSAATRTPSLSILNRVGSAPDLPLYNIESAGVYSSAKKRNLMKSQHPNGTGPRAIALQRSRLVPLPINIRTGTLYRDAGARFDSNSNNNNNNLHELRASRSDAVLAYGTAADLLQQQQQQIETKALDDFAIASLQQRLLAVEKDAARDLKQRQSLERQNAQLVRAQQHIDSEKLELAHKVELLEASALAQKLAFEKLSHRYTSVYSNLQKLTEHQHASSSSTSGAEHQHHTAALQSVLQALTKENQEFQRKLRVLEARHIDDKALAAKQEKKIKRLRAEVEALQHMNDASAAKDDAAAASDLQRAQSIKSGLTDAKSLKHALPVRSAAAGSATTTLSASSNAGGSSSTSHQHLISADAYQYIDPNILKVLEKVDSQFSISNAITLSAVLKKWLHSCLHVVSSTHIASVLQLLLKRVCELLHCEHAAIFAVDYTERKLIGKYTASGERHWELPLDKGIAGFAVRQNVLCNVPRAYDDPRFYSSTDTITGMPSREVLCIPIVHELQPSQPQSVFAVLQAWNTTHQKPFTPNDQILGTLLTIQAGTIFLQTQVAKTLQRINTKLLRILHMQHEITADEPTRGSSGAGSTTDVAPASLVHLVARAQATFSECIGIKKLKIYVLDVDVMRIWHVGSDVDISSGCDILVRKYSRVRSSLCSLVLRATSATASGVILDDPTSEATFNDTVDLRGGAGGLYLAPILSPWGATPLGMIQVARPAVSAYHPTRHSQSVDDVDPMFTAAVVKERQAAQTTDDALTLELIAAFARVFAGLLHHAIAQQLHDTCPLEVRNARLAYLTDRLDALERAFAQEQEEGDATQAQIERTLAAAAMMEQRVLNSAQSGRTANNRDHDGAGRSSDALARASGATRRGSFTVEVIRPRVNVQVRDSRRISSAGSSRQSVARFAQLRAVAAAPDMLPIEPDSDADNTHESDSKCSSPRQDEAEESEDAGDDKGSDVDDDDDGDPRGADADGEDPCAVVFSSGDTAAEISDADVTTDKEHPSQVVSACIEAQVYERGALEMEPNEQDDTDTSEQPLELEMQVSRTSIDEIERLEEQEAVSGADDDADVMTEADQLERCASECVDVQEPEMDVNALDGTAELETNGVEHSVELEAQIDEAEPFDEIVETRHIDEAEQLAEFGRPADEAEPPDETDETRHVDEAEQVVEFEHPVDEHDAITRSHLYDADGYESHAEVYEPLQPDGSDQVAVWQELEESANKGANVVGTSSLTYTPEWQGDNEVEASSGGNGWQGGGASYDVNANEDASGLDATESSPVFESESSGYDVEQAPSLNYDWQSGAEQYAYDVTHDATELDVTKSSQALESEQGRHDVEQAPSLNYDWQSGTEQYQYGITHDATELDATDSGPGLEPEQYEYDAEEGPSDAYYWQGGAEQYEYDMTQNASGLNATELDPALEREQRGHDVEVEEQEMPATTDDWGDNELDPSVAAPEYIPTDATYSDGSRAETPSTAGTSNSFPSAVGAFDL